MTECEKAFKSWQESHISRAIGSLKDVWMDGWIARQVVDAKICKGVKDKIGKSIQFSLGAEQCERAIRKAE